MKQENSENDENDDDDVFPSENVKFYEQYQNGYSGVSSIQTENHNFGDLDPNLTNFGTGGFESVVNRHSSNDSVGNNPFGFNNNSSDEFGNLDFYASLNLNNNSEEN